MKMSLGPLLFVTIRTYRVLSLLIEALSNRNNFISSGFVYNARKFAAMLILISQERPETEMKLLCTSNLGKVAHDEFFRPQQRILKRVLSQH